jgi:hypothetical protein
MVWYEPKHVVVTEASVVTSCVWRVFIDVFVKGANFFPSFFQFQSVSANRLARNVGSCSPIPCIPTSLFARYLLYPEDGGKNSSQVISIHSGFGKSLCTYDRCWKWCARASIQTWARLISFGNTFCRSACEMFLMYAVIAVFNSLSVCGRSRHTAEFAT